MENDRKQAEKHMQRNNRNPLKHLVRGVVSVGALLAIFAALIRIGHIEAIWRFTLAGVAVFYVACHLIPGWVYRLQSMPYTYQLHRNVGPTGLELQNVTYAAYHTVWYNYVKQHKSLKGLSPAMAAGISPTLWSMTDLAEIVETSLPKPGKRGPYKTAAA